MMMVIENNLETGTTEQYKVENVGQVELKPDTHYQVFVVYEAMDGRWELGELDDEWLT